MNNASITTDRNFTVVKGGLSVNEIMRKSRLAAARRRRMKKIGLVVFILALISVFSIIIFSNVVKAQGEDTPDHTAKGYTCITVQSNDTLWSIATEYSDKHYESIYQYIREVKELNGLTSDSIHAGAKLIIPVYAVPQEYAWDDMDICQGTR